MEGLVYLIVVLKEWYISLSVPIIPNFSNYVCSEYRRGFIMQTQEEMNVLVPEKLAEIERD